MRSHVQPHRFGLGSQRFELGGLAAVALVAALGVWVAVEATGRSSSSQPASRTTTAGSVAQLTSAVASIRHFVFWVGPRRGVTYELTQLADGSVRIRYLPPGVAAGSAGSYLTVATYPFLNPFSSIQTLTQQRGSAGLVAPGGGVGSYATRDPADVYLAYPGVDYQIEVFDPAPGSAEALVTSGRVSPVAPR